MDEQMIGLVGLAAIAVLVALFSAGLVVAGVVYVVHRLLMERRGAALPEPVAEDW